MNKFTKQARFNLLFLCLQYCTEQEIKGLGSYFTSGQRICINQERGKLLDFLDYKEFYKSPAPKVMYQHALQNKLDVLIEKIQSTNWQPKLIPNE